MDEAERVPIEIGHAVESEALAADRRTTVREDGTIVIDILAAQPCAPEPTTEHEIVVCAQLIGDAATDPPEDAVSAQQQLGEALNAKVGPLELGSIPRGDGTRAFGLRVRF